MKPFTTLINIFAKYTIRIILVAGLLTACSDNDNAQYQQGIFVDSPVSGISYDTPSRNGITGTDGLFLYSTGESVTFSIPQFEVGVNKSISSSSNFSQDRTVATQGENR